MAGTLVFYRLQDLLDVTFTDTAGAVPFWDTATDAFRVYGQSLRIQLDTVAPNDFAPNMLFGYSGNTIAADCTACSILAGGSLTQENRLLATLPDRAFLMNIGGGYDNQADSCYPTFITGAHHRVNMSPVHAGYTGVITHTPNLATNHVWVLSGTYCTLNDGGYCAIITGVGHLMDDYFCGAVGTGTTDNSVILGGAYHYNGSSNAGIMSGSAHSVFHTGCFMGGGLFNSSHGAYGAVVAGARNSIQKGVNCFIGNGSRNLIMPALIPATWLLDIGSQSSGTFTLNYGGYTTATNAYNISAANLTTALEALTSIGAGNVTVSLLATGRYLITLASGVAGQQMTGSGNSLGNRQLFNLTGGQKYLVDLGGATGGTFRAGYGRKDLLPDLYAVEATADLAYNVSAANFQTALEGLFSIGAGQVIVTTSGANYNVEFTADLTPLGYGFWINGQNLTGGGTWSYQSGTDPNYSGIGWGYYNAVRGPYASIVGGLFCEVWAGWSGMVNAVSSVISNTSSFYSGIGFGINHNIGNLSASPGCGIFSGANIWVNGTYSYAGGGQDHRIAANFAGVMSGAGITISAQYANSSGGSGHTLSGQYSWVPGGLTGVASGLASSAEGRDCSATTDYAHALGRDAAATHYGERAQASGKFSAQGDAQTFTVTMRRQTTNATPSSLLLDGSSLRLTIPTDTTWAFRILAVARRTDADDESAAYQLLGCIDNNAGTVALVGSVTKTVIAEDTAAWDFNASADNTNKALTVTATGENSKTINWVARVEATQVTG